MTLSETILISIITFIFGMFASAFGIYFSKVIDKRKEQWSFVEKWIDTVMLYIMKIHSVGYNLTKEENQQILRDLIDATANTTKISAIMGRGKIRGFLNTNLIIATDIFTNSFIKLVEKMKARDYKDKDELFLEIVAKSENVYKELLKK